MKRLYLALVLLPTAASAQLTDWVPESSQEHGSVRVEVAITPEGRAGDCRVIRTSGTTALDASACQIVSQQSRWRPAKNSSGAPEQAQAQMTLHFIMPHAPQTAADLPIAPGDVRILYSAGRDAAQRANHTMGQGKARSLERKAPRGNYDYPPEALRGGMQGVTWVVIDVDPKGRPTGCSVARSSGYAVLDKATCDFVRANLRYRPGTDYYGRPISDEDLFMLDWRLPS